MSLVQFLQAGEVLKVKQLTLSNICQSLVVYLVDKHFNNKTTSLQN